ncbi:MAG: hypothetical protein U0Z70_12155 [Thermomicrobiales bacterium]
MDSVNGYGDWFGLVNAGVVTRQRMPKGSATFLRETARRNALA